MYHRVGGVVCAVPQSITVEPPTLRRSFNDEMLECHVLRRRSQFRQANRSQCEQGVDEHGAAYQMQFHDRSHRFVSVREWMS